MKLGKFRIKNRRWYYANHELENPIVIIWKCTWLVPLFISLIIFSLIVALYNRDISDIAGTWTKNL